MHSQLVCLITSILGDADDTDADTDADVDADDAGPVSTISNHNSADLKRHRKSDTIIHS